MPTNPLTEVLPAKARRYVYAVLFVAALGFSAWQAADGDWKQFAAGLFTALVGATAASNTGPAPTQGEDGAADVGLGLLVCILLVVVLLLFGVHFR